MKGIACYGAPLLRRKNMPHFQAPGEAVPTLRNTERCLLKDPEKASAYSAEIKKLVDTGSVAKLATPEVSERNHDSSPITWFSITRQTRSSLTAHTSSKVST